MVTFWPAHKLTVWTPPVVFVGATFFLLLLEKKNFFFVEKKGKFFLEVCMGPQDFDVVGREKKIFFVEEIHTKISYMVERVQDRTRVC